MDFFAIFKILIANLPEIIGIIKAIKDNNSERSSDTQIKEDLRAVRLAFEAGDPQSLNALFRS